MGCGWLGLPLAKDLISDGYLVKGTTTSLDKLKTLKTQGIAPYQIALSEKEIKGKIANFLESITYLIINVPPGLRGKGVKESYIKKMQLLLEAIKKTGVKHIIFVSSTSVYGDITGDVNEETIPQPISESGKQLLATENLFKQDSTLKTTIIRFAGLIGPKRHPINILSTKKNLSDGNAPVNLIHLNDCIDIIKNVILENQWGQIFNGVHPEHPTKQEYYTKIALERGIKPPDYQIVDSKNYKKITTCKPFLIKNNAFFTPLYA